MSQSERLVNATLSQAAKPNKTEGPTGITCVAISPDNQIAAAGSLDKSIRFWGIQKGNFLGQFAGPSGHDDSVYAVAFSPVLSLSLFGSLCCDSV